MSPAMAALLILLAKLIIEKALQKFLLWEKIRQSIPLLI
jgi:hypothetical protein